MQILNLCNIIYKLTEKMTAAIAEPVGLVGNSLVLKNVGKVLETCVVT
jgi:hypothetical protein